MVVQYLRTTLRTSANLSKIQCRRWILGHQVEFPRQKYSPLSILSASEIGNYADLKVAIANGADIETRGRYGSTPLMATAQYGHVRCMSLLLDCGADIEAEKYGRTALIYAAVEGQLDCMKLLLDRGAAIEATDEARFCSLISYHITN